MEVPLGLALEAPPGRRVTEQAAGVGKHQQGFLKTAFCLKIRCSLHKNTGPPAFSVMKPINVLSRF